MNRLSLADLKAKANVIANVEAIKGGNAAGCHVDPPATNSTCAADATRVVKP